MISEDKNRKIFVNYIVVKINKFNLTIMKIDESSYSFFFFFYDISSRENKREVFKE